MILGIYKKFLQFFGFDSDPIAALEIGTTAVTVLQLSKLGGKVRLDHYAIEPFDPAGIVPTIKKALLKSRIKTKKFCIAIANSKIMTKTIKVSSQLNDKEIASEIELEIDKYFPYPLEELALDYTVLDRSNNKEEIDVLLSATKSQNITDLTNIMLEAQLVPVAVDIDAYAIARTFEKLISKINIEDQSKTFAIFDIGATCIIIIVINNGKVIHVHEQLLPEQELQQAVVLSIVRLYRDFITYLNPNVVDHIYLTGGGSNIVNLDKLIQQELQIETHMADPNAMLLLNPSISKPGFVSDSARLMKCYGLALRNLN